MLRIIYQEQDNNQTILDIMLGWINENIVPFIYAVLIIVLSYALYVFLKRQINRLKKKEKIDETTAKNLISFLKILIYVIVLVLLSIQFTEIFGTFAGVFTVAGGTIIGFAAMNTIGNVIAGLIVMLTRPFEVGDRIKFIDRLADVIDIKLVYTVLKDIDGVIISVPNQELLKTEIENYGKNRILRRKVHVSIGYDVDINLVEKVLINASKEFKTILKFPEPRVDVYELGNFAINYRLIVYINNSKIIPKFNYELRKAIYLSCLKNDIDLSTPSLIKSVNDNNQIDKRINIKKITDPKE